MSDDHLPATGQFCDVCSGEGHVHCWPDRDENEPAARLFTTVHNILEKAAA